MSWPAAVQVSLQELNESEESTKVPPAAWPWATMLAAAVAVVVFAAPALQTWLEFDRARIAEGEWWRALTGHWVHFSGSHLAWNLALFVPAGVWAERLLPARTRALLAISPFVIGFSLFGLLPALERYAGLSGIAAGLLAFLSLAQLRIAEKDRWFWWSVLVLMALKIATEAVLASPLLAQFPDPTVRSVPLAHLAGVVTGVGVLYGRRLTS